MGNVRRALVADDEESIVFLLTSLLQLEGVDDIATASDGSEALSLIEREGATFCLACIDVNMPGRGGAELVKAARAKGLTMPIIVISGQAEDPSMRTLGPGTQYLAKPFSTGHFRAIVRGLLAPTP